MLPEHLRVLYLHGFASSPGSRKARFFVRRLTELGLEVEVPDLAEGDFRGLTISRQLAVVERLARNERVILIGSSLGGYVASLYAARHPEVEKLILLAPAFHLFELWKSEMAQEQLAAWRENGQISVYHYGEGRHMPLDYGLMEDASLFEASPDFSQPALIFHGNKDLSVPVQFSVEFAQSHRNVQLVRLESGHELTDVLDVIWQLSEKFLLAG